jgi:hypothetical protein
MKKYLFLLLTTLPMSLLAQQKPDTVKLKNGQVIAGYIYKIDDGKIYIAASGDSLVYNADEVQSLMFCHSLRSNMPYASSSSDSKSNTGSSGSSKSYSNTSTFSSLDDTDSPVLFSEKDDEKKGVAIFRCNMCGANGSLLIRGANDNSKSSATYTFSMEKDKHFFVYAAKLLPGEYNWKYSDTNNNETKGSLIIRKGEEKKIVLFEKE